MGTVDFPNGVDFGDVPWNVGDCLTVYSGSGQTSGAVMVDLVTITVPNYTTGQAWWYTVGYESSSNYYMSCFMSAFKKTVSTSVYSTLQIYMINSIATVEATLVGSGNNLIVRAVGAAGHTINWKTTVWVQMVT